MQIFLNQCILRFLQIKSVQICALQNADNFLKMPQNDSSFLMAVKFLSQIPTHLFYFDTPFIIISGKIFKPTFYQVSQFTLIIVIP